MDEHDFYEGKYLPPADGDGAGGEAVAAEPAVPAEAPKIVVEVIITGLSPEQEARFGGSVEWLDVTTGAFYTAANPAGVDAANIKAALRVTFVGA